MRSLAFALVAVVACFAAACSEKADAPPAAPTAPPESTATSAPTLTRPTPLPTLSGAAPPATVAPRSERRLGSPTGAAHTFGEPGFQPLAGARAVFGQLGSAIYRIEVPAQWNGELVLYAHGVRLENNILTVSNPPAALRRALIDGGFAWAASSYSENQYVPGIGADDTLALADHFAATIGAPKRTYIVGESMGGHVLALLMEQFPSRFDGGLALCGAVGGEEEIDFLISWAMVAEYTSGVRLPLEAGSNLAEVLIRQVAPALGTPDAPTSRGKQFLSIVRETDGRRPSLLHRRDAGAVHAQLRPAPDRSSPQDAPRRRGDQRRNRLHHRLRAGIDRDGGQLRGPPPRTAGGRGTPAAIRCGPHDRPNRTPAADASHDGRPLRPYQPRSRLSPEGRGAGRADLLVQRAIRAPGHCHSATFAAYGRAERPRAGADGKKPAGDDLLGDLANIGRAFTNPLRPGDPGTP